MYGIRVKKQLKKGEKNMKKFIATVLAAVAACTTFCFASCGDKKDEAENIKVMKEIMLTEEDYAFAIAKENADLLSAVNNYLATWESDGSLDTLINSYFDGTATFTYENKSASPTENDFVMATNAYFPPFEYKEGSKFKGVDVEIAYKLATAMNKTLFVYDMEFDSIIPSVKNGESDIGMAGMTVNETRRQQVNFATPYYSSAQVISVLASDTTFDACKTAADVEAILATKDKNYVIGTQNATTGFMYSAGNADFEYDGFTNLTTKGYTTGALAMKDLQNGKINAVILDMQPSLMIADSMNK
ncbi:MAG: transporter substrate-binding domain-containing protein [Clostridiales bacterium]|nr:transporter substrate-binding domain-containing protein [Clostridiales bacterium]